MRIRNREGRRGIILLVVVAMLALFAVVGISFVLYAESAANSARIAREGQNGGHTGVAPGLNIVGTGAGADAPPIPNEIFNRTLGSLIYDADDASGKYNALRGWSLARDMYGYRAGYFNSKAFAGLGLPEGLAIGTAASLPTDTPGSVTADRPYNYINYTPSSKPADWATYPLRDPEYYQNVNGQLMWGTNSSAIFIPKNVPYTAFDNNHLYLGAIDPGTGNLILPSFFRPGHLESTGFTNYLQPETATAKSVFNPANPAMTGASGRYRTLRPHPYDHPNFPAVPLNPDGSRTGDVANLEGKTNPQNDSIWMDIDLPVRRWRGKNYKPLVAVLITDLDSRINVNVAGNITPGAVAHRSNQGWGPWEQDMSLALGMTQSTGVASTGAVADVASVLRGSNPAARFSQSTNPTGYDSLSNPVPSPYTSSPRYGALNDWSPTRPFARADYLANASAQLTQQTAASYNSVPLFPTGYTSPLISDLASTTPATAAQTAETSQFASVYEPQMHNPYLSESYAPANWQQDHILGAGEMRVANFKYRGEFTAAQASAQSNLIQMLTNFGSSPSSLFRITTLSSDLQSPGLQGYMYTGTSQPVLAASQNPALPAAGSQPGGTIPAGTVNFGGGPNNTALLQFPAGTGTNAFPVPSPNLYGGTKLFETDYDSNYQNGAVANFAGGITPSIETYTAGVSSLLAPVDLNRALPTIVTVNPAAAVASNNTAIKERQILARDIFLRLAQAAGIWPNPPEPTAAYFAATTNTANYRNLAYYSDSVNPGIANAIPNFTNADTQKALRYLAQLAVNAVDYIDSDDAMTPFNFRNLDPEDPNYLNTTLDAKAGTFPTLDSATRQTEILFGVEAPRLVINEVYSHLRNDPSDPVTDPVTGKKYAAKPARVQSWIELKNPLGYQGVAAGGKQAATDTTAPSTSTQVNLNQYRLLRINVTDTTANTYLAALQTYNPETFKQLFFTATGAAADTKNTAIIPSTASTTPVVPASAVNGGNDYFVLGPTAAQTAPSTDGAPLPLVTVSLPVGLSGTTETLDYTQTAATSYTVNNYHIFVLQRLAQGSLSVTPTPATYTAATRNTDCNEWVTVDYFSQLAETSTAGFGAGSGLANVFNNVTYNGSGPYTPNPQTALSAQASLGRRQPLDGANVAAQTQTTNNFRNTFRKHNLPTPTASTASLTAGRYTWYNHLDRQLVAPTELFAMAAYPNHRIAHQFHYDAAQQRLLHLASWNDATSYPAAAGGGNFAVKAADSARLFRALALLDTKSRVYGMPFGGRIPGKVNINTVLATSTAAASPVPEAFAAVCSASSGNRFTYADVQAAWTAINARRFPGDANHTKNMPSFADSPFLPPGTPIYGPHTGNNAPTNFYARNGVGIANTLLSNDLFTHAADKASYIEPGYKNEMLNKVYNSFTTRSNAFQVWCTIGYFEVLNDGPYTPANRPQLGTELGSNEGTAVRHKFYSVVDRTNLATYNSKTYPSSANGGTQVGAPVLFEFQPAGWEANPATPTNNPSAQNTATRQPIANTTYYEYTVTLPSYLSATTVTAAGLDLNLPDKFSTAGTQNCVKRLGGEYDGKQWRISQGILAGRVQSTTRPGSVLIVGVGTPNEEQVTIGYTNFGTSTVPNYALTGYLHGFNATAPASASTQSGPFQVTLRTLNRHYPGEAIALGPLMAGTEVPDYVPYYANPGPQVFFNYQAFPYTDVVKYAVQVK